MSTVLSREIIKRCTHSARREIWRIWLWIWIPATECFICKWHLNSLGKQYRVLSTMAIQHTDYHTHARTHARTHTHTILMTTFKMNLSRVPLIFLHLFLDCGAGQNSSCPPWHNSTNSSDDSCVVPPTSTVIQCLIQSASSLCSTPANYRNLHRYMYIYICTDVHTHVGGKLGGWVPDPPVRGRDGDPPLAPPLGPATSMGI